VRLRRSALEAGTGTNGPESAGRVADAGRDPLSVPIIAEHTVITAPDSVQANEKHEACRRVASEEGALVLMSGWTGIDLSGFELDAPFEHRESQAIQFAVEAMSSADPGRVWSIR
jgi:alkanesulfonate monooxygenase SsuD/methylene tetrahydromethanopterin reductase-like flavin-dependent oxidoreductase (luciferase family)